MSLWTEVKGSWSSVFEVWGSYWKLYGGWRALLVSPYFHVAIFCTAICYRFWSRPEWWETVISVAPTFLGFTLAGLAIFFSVSDEGFKRIIAYKDSDSPSSPFLDIVVAFVNFVVWQGAAFLMALIAKSLFFIWATAPRFYLELLPFLNVLGWGFGFLIFAYSSLLLLAATFSIFRVARWYETHVTTSVDDEDK
ncbi:hypothetical protein ACOAQZ_27340 [Pseudomonas aeruginosa]|uniref:Uncharacterized protein n=2 Tax=Pseudomonas aeruginosa TaxID=287 RepID=A0A643I6E6_PSEAI|nr:hypothetical protein [Pseudomonas aeruginosa]EKQ6319294.1 hypothetical protein [Pseudomonas aeruginosa]EKX3432101.1 hypothetical protein [Pseudomonas aeruginosa]ELK4919109.1 hypothetical protein [Pseudomonas aeruginosa]ELO0956347.1 hypothetical protein [Pseudomonas aeruginosa]ELY3882903.1 hypothetical protein [Pseudomonas aeruginosa]